MPIEFNCTQCGSLLRTPDDTAGKQAKCPQCGAVVAIPAAKPPVIAPALPSDRTSDASEDAENPYRSPVMSDLPAFSRGLSSVPICH